MPRPFCDHVCFYNGSHSSVGRETLSIHPASSAAVADRSCHPCSTQMQPSQPLQQRPRQSIKRRQMRRRRRRVTGIRGARDVTDCAARPVARPVLCRARRRLSMHAAVCGRSRLKRLSIIVPRGNSRKAMISSGGGGGGSSGCWKMSMRLATAWSKHGLVTITTAAVAAAAAAASSLRRRTINCSVKQRSHACHRLTGFV
jgi:hypothetical protein